MPAAIHANLWLSIKRLGALKTAWIDSFFLQSLVLMQKRRLEMSKNSFTCLAWKICGFDVFSGAINA